MGQYLVWLFIWDDSIDKEIDPDHSDFASDLLKADSYRVRTIEFIKQQLQLCCESAPVGPPTRECEIFRQIAPMIVNAGDQIKLSQLAYDLKDFIDSNSTEQRFRLSGHTPTVNEYWSYRHGTGAIGAICSLAQ
jgi:hypothetical protein